MCAKASRKAFRRRESAEGAWCSSTRTSSREASERGEPATRDPPLLTRNVYARSGSHRTDTGHSTRNVTMLTHGNHNMAVLQCPHMLSSISARHEVQSGAGPARHASSRSLTTQ